MSRKTQFNVDMAKAIENSMKNAETIVMRATVGLFRSIVLKTPVDTGYLAANWQIGIASPKANVVNYLDPEKEHTLLNGAKEVAKWTLNDKTIWISNNVEYAEDIEYGRSRVKAPQGMVRVSLREFDAIFKGAAMSVNSGTGSKGNRYR